MNEKTPVAPMVARLDLLRIDSGGGLIAGVAMLLLADWLHDLYALPRSLLIGIGVANLAYGTYSGLLLRRPKRPPALILALVVANAAWAVLCLALTVRYRTTASAFGLLHLVGEGLFVGGLAALESRARDALRTRA